MSLQIQVADTCVEKFLSRVVGAVREPVLNLYIRLLTVVQHYFHGLRKAQLIPWCLCHLDDRLNFFHCRHLGQSLQHSNLTYYRYVDSFCFSPYLESSLGSILSRADLIPFHHGSLLAAVGIHDFYLFRKNRSLSGRSRYGKFLCSRLVDIGQHHGRSHGPGPLFGGEINSPIVPGGKLAKIFGCHQEGIFCLPVLFVCFLYPICHIQFYHIIMKIPDIRVHDSLVFYCQFLRISR